MTGQHPTEALFREHRERLTRFARHLVGGGPDVEDLVQETFLRAHHHLSNGKEIRAPLGFLFVTMRNLVADAGRRTGGERLEALTVADEVSPDDAVPSAERRAISQRELEHLCLAIAELPRRMRYAFVLRTVYGYSCREIAELLGRSVNTVREQVAQSFKRLRAMDTGGVVEEQDGRSASDAGPRSGAKDGAALQNVVLTRIAKRESAG